MGAHVRITAAIIGAANINEMIMAERSTKPEKVDARTSMRNERINNRREKCAVSSDSHMIFL